MYVWYLSRFKNYKYHLTVVCQLAKLQFTSMSVQTDLTHVVKTLKVLNVFLGEIETITMLTCVTPVWQTCCLHLQFIFPEDWHWASPQWLWVGLQCLNMDVDAQKLLMVKQRCLPPAQKISTISSFKVGTQHQCNQFSIWWNEKYGHNLPFCSRLMACNGCRRGLFI